MRWSLLTRTARLIVTSDPGRVRLRSAAATTLSLVLAMAALLALTNVVHQPVTVAMLGTIVAMQSSAAVKDRQQHSRVVTTLLLFFPAIGAVAMAAFLSPLGTVADVGFIAVVFGAVWVRRFGPRGNALGMVAFMSYFFTLFLRATPGQIPVLAVAVAVGLSASLIVRTLVFPDRPHVEVRRLCRALRVSSVSVLEVVTHHAEYDLTVLRRRLDRLGETALMIDDWLDRNDAAQSLSVTSRDLALRVFDAQIAMEQLGSLLWSLPADDWPSGLRDTIAALGTCLQNHPTEELLRAARKSAAAAAERADLSTSSGIATVVGFRVIQAHLAIHHISTKALGVSEDETPEPELPPEEVPAGLKASTKAAIQVAIATSAATIIGELISPDRWYWAVLTAFLVFTGVSTRGEILSRAGHRMVGTIAGVVAGVLLAALVGHDPPVQLALLVICVFCAFYLVTVAYAWLTFFTTVLLAMLYGLLGDFSFQVLELRIAETAAGGVVGIASAYFILSTGTRSTLVAKVNDYLDQLTDVIDAGLESVLSPGGETELVAETRLLDNALQSVITAGKPLQMGLATRSRHSTRRLVRGLQVSNRSAHAMARAGVNAARAAPDSAPADVTATALRDAAGLVSDAVDNVKRVIAGDGISRHPTWTGAGSGQGVEQPRTRTHRGDGTRMTTRARFRWLLVLAPILPLMACGQSPSQLSVREIELPPVTGVFDYQLGGAYDMTGIAVLVRDESAVPLPGAYDVCYLNGFQTQPGTGDDWSQNHGAALLRNADGSLVIDPDWPDEYVLDPSTPDARKVILGVMGPLISSCADKGFNAVEIDNFDTFTRFTDSATGRVDRAGALDLARSYVSLAHAGGLAIGQKNAAESTETGRHDVGFDFAVAEECAAHRECASYRRAYGPHVMQIEYTDDLPEPFDEVCSSPDRGPLTILRDRDLVARGTTGYVYQQC